LEDGRNTLTSCFDLTFSPYVGHLPCEEVIAALMHFMKSSGICKKCIKAAITSSHGKCPTCGKRVKSKQLVRVFLPSYNRR